MLKFFVSNADAEARATEARFVATLQAAVGQSKVAMVICDSAFTVQLANASGQALFGCDESDGPGVHGLHWFWETAQIDAEDALGTIRRDGFWRGCRLIPSVTGGGVPAEVEIEISPFRGDDDGFTITAREVAPTTKLSRHAADCDVILRSPHLTQREKEVMLGLLEGCSNKVIGLKMAISPRTVEFHRSRLMHRFGAKSLVELIRNVVHGNHATSNFDHALGVTRKIGA